MRVECGLLISTSLLALLASACSSSEGDGAADTGGNAALVDGGASEPMGAGGSSSGSGTGGMLGPGSGGLGNTGGGPSSDGGTLNQGSGGQPGVGEEPAATSGGGSSVVTDPGVGGGMTTGGSRDTGGDSNLGGAPPSTGGSGEDGSDATGGNVGPLPGIGGSSSGGAGSGGRWNTGGSGSVVGTGGRRNTGGASAGEVGGSTSEAGNSGAPTGGSGVGGEPSGTSAGAAGTAGSGPDDECPCSGTIEYVLNDSESWPADVFARLSEAMEEAVWYYNCYANLSHSLTVNYTTDGSAVPTAQANVDGWMTFGPDPAYQVLATVMHEMGHTMGVAYYPWTELTDANRHWTGAAVNALMASLPEDEKDPGEPDFITADSMHFWPYGLNYASEYKSEWSLINHVRIVAAMNVDKQDYLNQ